MIQKNSNLLLGAALFLAGMGNTASAQSSPAVSTLPFSFTSHTGTTLPTGIAAHRFGTAAANILTSAASTEANGDLPNGTGTTGGWAAQTGDGISMLASGSNAAGAFVIRFSTTGRQDTTVAWTARTILQQASRNHSLTLQYKVPGTVDTWTTVGSSTYDTTGQAANHSSNFNVVLQDNTDNAAEVQLRWLYWENSGAASGSRDRIGLDDISVTSSPIPAGDTTAPTLTSVTIGSNNASAALAKAGDVITVSLTADESITQPTVTIAGNSATVSPAGPATSYTATYTVLAGATQGTAAISISAYADAATNAGSTVTATTNSSAVLIDTVAPSVSGVSSVSSNATNTLAKAGDVITTTINLSESATQPTVTIAGNAASVSPAGPATSYTATYTVLAGDTQGAAAVAVTGFGDAAGNAGTASNTNGPAIDTVAPSVTGVSSVSNNATNTLAKAGDVITATISLSESATQPTVTIAGNAASVSPAGPATSYTATYTVLAGDTQGAAAVAVTGFGDAAGNAGTASNTNGPAIDTVAPVSSASATAVQFGSNVIVSSTANDASGVADVDLFASAAGASFVNAGLTAVSGTFTFPAAGSGVYDFYTVATDAAGNVESKSAAEASVKAVTVENGAFPLAVATSGVYVFPMEPGLSVSIQLDGVTTGGTLTVSRTEGNTAPAGIDAARLIDQSIVITATGGLTFTSASVTVSYDEALLGGVAEAAITRAYRDQAGVVTDIAATVNEAANTVTFTTDGFSTWYFGEINASVSDWSMLAE